MDPYAWAWNAEGLVLVPIAAAAYAFSVWTYGAPPRWRVASFSAGLVLLLAVSVTPIQTLALDYLLSAHLLQNVVLAEWAPALLVLGIPSALAASLGRNRIVAALTHPLVALPIWLATYFVWHLPGPYTAALEHRSTLLHLEHASYLVSGCLLWWPVVHAARRRLSSAGRTIYLFAAFVLASPLGLLLALLPSPVYDFYEVRAGLWGWSALTDQRIAGLTMAAEQAVVFFAAFMLFFVRFLNEEEAPAHAPAAR
jgi:putative membrane protein